MSNSYYAGTGSIKVGKVTPEFIAIMGDLLSPEDATGRLGEENVVLQLSSPPETDSMPEWDNVLYHLAKNRGMVGTFKDLTNLGMLQRIAEHDADKGNVKAMLAAGIYSASIEHPRGQLMWGELWQVLDVFVPDAKVEYITFSGAWWCDKPLSNSFGGDTLRYSKHVRMEATSSNSEQTIRNIESAIKTGVPSAVANIYMQQINGLLEGMCDATLAFKVRQELTQLLLQYGTDEEPKKPDFPSAQLDSNMLG